MFRKLVFLFCILIIPYAYAKFHDPTCPPGMSQPYNGTTKGDLQIKSIMITPNEKTVIIGDRHLTIGDRIMGARIIAINQNTVTLQGTNGKFTIAMFHPIVKNEVTKNGER